MKTSLTKSLKNQVIFWIGIVFILLQTGCNEGLDAIDDAQQLAALKKVTIAKDSLIIDFVFPDGALTSGKSFAELVQKDSATYTNPENYSIILNFYMTADNTQDGAKDAKFDGMTISTVFDTITSTPVTTTAPAFTVQANTTKTVIANGTINLKTHRLVGLYIFAQTVAGDKIKTTLSPILHYKIGSQQGEIKLPNIVTEIPTRASAETKEFLSGLLASGIFDPL